MLAGRFSPRLVFQQVPAWFVLQEKKGKLAAFCAHAQEGVENLGENISQMAIWRAPIVSRL